MIRTYFVELEGSKSVCGETYVEVEEVLYDDGTVDEAATKEAAREAAFKDVHEYKVTWESYNGEVSDVDIISISRD